MLTKAELLGQLVWFAAVNDADLLDEDRILTSEMCASADRASVRKAARLVDSLLKSYSYVRSPEFAEEIAGKSDAFVRMRTKIAEEPVKRPTQRRRAERALASLLSSDAAYDLFSPDQHEALDEVRKCFRALANPA